LNIEECKGEPDFASLAKIIRRGLPPALANASIDDLCGMYKEHYNPVSDSVYLMKDGGQTIGWYRYSLWPRDRSDTTEAHLLDIAVAESHQRKGLGKELLRHCLDICRQKGFRRIFSATEESNTGSIGLHASEGFTVDRKQGGQIVWVKNLQD
jgi:GNAT superfamily N-acetyltransferase